MDHVIELLSPKIRKLYVNTGSRLLNLRALNLYLKKGFKIEAVLKDYYGEGEAQIMLGMNFLNPDSSLNHNFRLEYPLAKSSEFPYFTNPKMLWL